MFSDNRSACHGVVRVADAVNTVSAVDAAEENGIILVTIDTSRIPLRTGNGWVFVVLANVKTQPARIDVAVAPDHNGAECYLGEDVEHTVENTFRIGVNDVATFREAPRNWVEEPQETRESTAHEEDAANILALDECVTSSFPKELVKDEKKCGTPESIVTPLVSGPGQGTDETADNHNHVDEDGPEDCRPWHVGSEE